MKFVNIYNKGDKAKKIQGKGCYKLQQMFLMEKT